MPEVTCPICSSHVTITSNESEYIHIYNCPVCGRFEYYPLVSDFHSFPINKLKAFLAYNNYPCLPSEARYFSFRSKESCSKLKKQYESGNLSGGYPVHLDLVDVNNWYPDTFSQKIDFLRFTDERLLILYNISEARYCCQEAGTLKNTQ